MVVDVAQWDATRLPLRSQCVDVVVSDLPFGKRLGRKADNRVLYYHSLVELARVTKLKTGRAVLLTTDTNSMIKVRDLQIESHEMHLLIEFYSVLLIYCILMSFALVFLPKVQR